MESSKEVVEVAKQWVFASPEDSEKLEEDYYCPSRDVFQARLDKMTELLLKKNHLPEDKIYLLAAVSGEIGNNSFDHNSGNWPDVAGIFFGYHFSADQNEVVLADRGQGVLATLRKVKPQLTDDLEALKTAFLEKISGRKPERRGQGLKFVKETVIAQSIGLVFYSGSARAEVDGGFRVSPDSRFVRGCLAVLSFSAKVRL